MLINLSNHSLSSWSDKQKIVAQQQFGQIVDLAFPSIQPEAGLKQVKSLATAYVQKCLEMLGDKATDEHARPIQQAVHIMGEMTFVYQFIRQISEYGILCVASTSNRIVETEENGRKISRFEFVRFRAFTNELF